MDQILLTFSDATSKKDYTEIDEDIKDRVFNYYQKEMGLQELKLKLFSILDARLGTYKTPFQARTYQKIITAFGKCRILDTQEINLLFLKAKRFLAKENVKKEKIKIKNEIKSNFIAMGKPSINSNNNNNQ